MDDNDFTLEGARDKFAEEPNVRTGAVLLLVSDKLARDGNLSMRDHMKDVYRVRDLLDGLGL